jgi:hypothetical protein
MELHTSILQFLTSTKSDSDNGTRCKRDANLSVLLVQQIQ